MQDFYIDVLHTQKAGNAASEYEDAFWPAEPTSRARGKKVRAAVADGATDAVYSGLWARLLVKAYGKRRMADGSVEQQLGKAGRIWRRTVGRKPLPWYAEEKARAGAFAAFVGIELSRDGDRDCGSWSAIACGDSCFFQLRSEAVIEKFPLASSDEFSSAPVLLGSQPEMGGLEGIRMRNGSWQEGDFFYVMSDALALWFLTRCEAGEAPWQCLRDVTLAKKPSFDEWIASLRLAREIKNDDCTLIGISSEHC